MPAMATEILKSFGTLQNELEQAKSSLKGVDENIKRLIGRDPSETIAPSLRNSHKRPNSNAEEGPKHRWGLGGNRRVYTHDNDEPPTVKRRGGVFNRLSDRVGSDRVTYHDEDNSDNFKGNRQMISKVIVTPKEVPSRQEALDAQSGDEKFKARNRRMFGALLGTLQKFQQEETKLKPKEEKRAQLEKKIEEIEIREKAEIKKERQELFQNRKKKQAEIKMIELKMQKMKTYAQWEELQVFRMNFIQTKSKPSIHYLPKRLTDITKTALEESKKSIQKMIDDRKEEVMQELKVIEDKMQWNFRTKNETNENEEDFDENNESEDNHKENEPSLQEDEKMEEDTPAISNSVKTEDTEDTEVKESNRKTNLSEEEKPSQEERD